MTNQHAALMVEAVKASVPDLKERGFQKRRHAFNRVMPSGLVHVICFRAGQVWSVLHGTFDVVIGVHVPEMVRRYHTPRSDWINEYDAHAHQHLGLLMAGDEAPVEWPLTDPRSARHAREAVMAHAIPWLDQFPDHDSLLAVYLERGPSAVGIATAGLDIALMLEELGREREGRAVLEAYLEKGVHEGHAEYLRDEWLPASGHADLIPRIRVVHDWAE